MKLPNTVLAAFAATLITSVALAAAVASPAGNWKWTAQGRNGAQEYTAKFEVKEGKLTGAVTSPRGDTPISQGTFKDGEIAFVTEIAFNDMKFVIKYAGKVEGDVIKGTIERPGRDGGAATKTDWNATRVK
jgi:hypothetical protein